MGDMQSMRTEVSNMRKEIEQMRQEQTHAQQSMGQVILTYSKCTDILSGKIDALKSDLQVFHTLYDDLQTNINVLQSGLGYDLKEAIALVKEDCQTFTRQQLLIMQTMWSRRHEERMEEIEMMNTISADVMLTEHTS
jgi:hypothetical protein